MIFRDRLDAGTRLASALARFRDQDNTVVLGIPRGGLVVGKAIATDLHLPLGVCPVRKVGAPENPELALGAVDDDAVLVFDRRLTRHLHLSDAAVQVAAASTRSALRSWLAAIGPRAVPPVVDRSVILTDDGVATGYTAEAGVQSLRRRGAARIILAVPVAPRDTAERLAAEADEWVCLATPEPFYAVGNFFEEWPQVEDDQVRSLLLAGNTL